VQLRLTYFERGLERQTIWSFEPLRDKKQAPQYLRDDRQSGDGSPLRRPYAEQAVRLVTFGAGLVSFGSGADSLKLLQRAHRIEFDEGADPARPVWVEYAPDLGSQLDLQLLEDIDDLVYCEIKFIEKKPRYFPDWT
jgi:hypothetical protein